MYVIKQIALLTLKSALLPRILFVVLYEATSLDIIGLQ